MSEPTGIIIATTKSACPAGWSEYSDLDGYFLKVEASPDVTPSGSNYHTHTDSHTHTISTTAESESLDTKKTGSLRAWSAPHTHTISLTSATSSDLVCASADHSPSFATIKLCRKN